MFSLRETYNRIAGHFDVTRYRAWDEVKEFLETIPKGSLVLDVGAGNGRHSLLAKKLGLKPVALDFSIELLRIIRKKDKSIPLVLGDVNALPFKKVTYIIYIATIHHLKKRLESLFEIKRVLDKGKFLVSAWAFEQPRFSKYKKQDIDLKWNRKYPRFYHLFKKGELDKLIKKAGFKIESSFESNGNYWVIGSE